MFANANRATGAVSSHPEMEAKMRSAHADMVGVAGQDLCSPARPPKMGLAMLDSFDVVISRLVNTSDRIETVADRMLGQYPVEKDDNGVMDGSAGLVGEVGRKFSMLLRICDALEKTATRLENLA